jgi:tetratricopeptide (TPR) repeat protein
MSKKKKQNQLDSVNLPRRLRQGIEEADDLLAQGKPQEALELLHELDKKFPLQPNILGLLVNAYLDIHDQQGYLHSIYKLHTLTPNKAEIKLGLAGAYLTNEFLALALQTFRQFIRRWPNDERAIDVRKTIAQLELGLPKILSEIGFSMETGFNFACQHEELRLQMEMGNYDRCRKLAKPLLEQRPQFAPVLNNLSLVEWLEGNLPGAIEISQKVLEFEPENIHALSNITRFLFMLGRVDESSFYAQRLKQSQAEAADFWIKKAEALSFTGDADGVIELIEQAKLTKSQKELGGLVWHWGAVAAYRSGQIAKARKYWQKSSLDPRSLDLAQANLEELEKPLPERTCPQAFTIDAWISRKTIELMAVAVERFARNENDLAFREKINLFIDSHPELINFVLQALQAGDSQCRKFALQLAEMSAHPKILSDLREFMFGQQGPDALRIKASQVLAKHNISKSGEMVDVWLKGKWTPIMLFGIQISNEPTEKPTLKPTAQRLMEQAIYALQDDEGEKAEKFLRKALDIQGDEHGRMYLKTGKFISAIIAFIFLMITISGCASLPNPTRISTTSLVTTTFIPTPPKATVPVVTPFSSPLTPELSDYAFPDSIDATKAYLFYLHGKIIEDQGLPAISPDFGEYEYTAILEKLREYGFVVISEQRAKNTASLEYAKRVAGQITQLLEAGVPAQNITVLGASKGAGIAIDVSHGLENSEINFVIMAICAPETVQELIQSQITLYGNILSIYDSSDSLAGSCQDLFAFSEGRGLAQHNEIVLSIGTGHGILYKPLDAWVVPAAQWASKP